MIFHLPLLAKRVTTQTLVIGSGPTTTASLSALATQALLVDSKCITSVAAMTPKVVSNPKLKNSGILEKIQRDLRGHTRLNQLCVNLLGRGLVYQTFIYMQKSSAAGLRRNLNLGLFTLLYGYF